jgi:mannonate dehydratase
MKRREFFKGAGLGALALGGCASSAPAGPAPSGGRALMKLGTQQASPTDDMLRYFAQFGVTHICGTPPRAGLKGSWEVDDLLKLRERVELFGISLDMLPLPMSAWPISRSESPHIMLAKNPERDREIDLICENIRAASEGRHSRAQVQPDVPRRGPDGADAGPRRLELQHLQL